MSNKNNPYQKIKHFIELLEERLSHDGFNTITLGRRTEKTKSFDYESHTRKAIDHDLVRLYVHNSDRTKSNSEHMNHMTMALSFDYVALEEEKIYFSYSNANATKDPVYSPSFNAESTRNILKHTLKSNPDVYGDSFIKLLKAAFIDGELGVLVNKDISDNHKLFKQEKKSFKALVEDRFVAIEDVTNGYEPATKVISDNMAQINAELLETPEHAEVVRLEALLLIAKSELAIVKNAKIAANDKITAANEIRQKVVGSIGIESYAAEALQAIIELTKDNNPVIADARASYVHNAYNRLVKAVRSIKKFRLDTYELDVIYKEFKAKQEK